MGAVVGLVAFVFAVLPVLIFVLVVVSLAKGVSQSGGEGPSPKAASPTTPAAQTIRRTEARMDALDAWHEGEDCTFSYSTRDPNFSFNGRQVVDELAELRRKNEAHERHLLARVHRD